MYVISNGVLVDRKNVENEQEKKEREREWGIQNHSFDSFVVNILFFKLKISRANFFFCVVSSDKFNIPDKYWMLDECRNLITANTNAYIIFICSKNNNIYMHTRIWKEC